MSIFPSLRPLFGFWNQLRRLNTLIEWLYINGVTGQMGEYRFTVNPIGLPPTKSEIKSAEKEKIEQMDYNEERYAAERAVEIMKKRARGEKLDDDDPGRDFELY